MKKYGLFSAVLVVVVLAVPMVSLAEIPSFWCDRMEAPPSEEIESGVAPYRLKCWDTSTGATSWQWDFGNGETSTKQGIKDLDPVIVVYSSPGGYQISLTINEGPQMTKYVEVAECPLSSLPVKLMRSGAAPTPACPALVEDRFPTLQEAYLKACDGDTILVIGLNLIPQVLTAKYEIAVTVEGGYECSSSFTNVVNNTILTGAEIQRGAVTMGNFTLE